MYEHRVLVQFGTLYWEGIAMYIINVQITGLKKESPSMSSTYLQHPPKNIEAGVGINGKPSTLVMRAQEGEAVTLWRLANA